ncbi:hypothetical protein SAY86_010181 [Trapa natans]|uniref:Uncharacterized protein n=1 Tax=Trapa natans TaxID=22666 RepID=A0AAN7QRW0_TRANT|nr:hypothetical protein SAY86_010181 [Trapa natans]
MPSSSKLDLSSGSPDKQLYVSGHCRPQAMIPMDRSGSFRESMETSPASSLHAVPRNSSVIAQTDVLNFFQCLPFDSKLLALDHKSNRQGDLKRNVAVALGCSPDSPANILKGKLVALPSPEELKRVKLGLRESSSKARERAKTFTEALSLLSKSFPSLSTKKRSRSDVSSNDRSGSMFSSDRPVLGHVIGKAGPQSNITANAFEQEVHKPEESTKKRPRTSLVDVKQKVQGHVPSRASGLVDREKVFPKLAGSSSVCEDRTKSIGLDGWEKSKTKKRSGIRPDATSVISTKPIDGHRELKQGVQQKLVSDARKILNSEAHEFRQGFLSGTLGVGKSEATSQQTGMSMRVSSPKLDQDGSSFPGDMRDRPLNSDKERLNLITMNKSNYRDDFNSASPTSSTRMNTSIRGPRTGSSTIPKSAQIMNRANGPINWEVPHSTNRPAAVGANNKKRSASVQSSSPPASQWSGQHPKTSRTGRRTNLGPSISSNDEASPLDTTSDVGGSHIGLGILRRFSDSSPQLVKLKGDLLSSSTLSEGEDSGTAEIKSRDRLKESDEMDEKSGQHVQKVPPAVISSRKTKIVPREDHRDGTKRQGRNGRSFTSTRSLLQVRAEKLGHEETGKQLRTARHGLDKTESKAGRQSTRKLSDRRSYTRKRHASVNTSADFLVGLDDGQEELLVAANAVINPTDESLKSFWKEMEPLFGFISDIDIDYLKEQGNFRSTMQMSTLNIHVATDDLSSPRNALGSSETEIHAGDQTRISLFERCLAALIPDEGSSINADDELRMGVYKSTHGLKEELESNGFSYESTQHSVSAVNGYMVTCMPEYQGHVNDMQIALVNEKLMLEIQSIATFPEGMLSRDPVESAEIDGEIDQLVDSHHMQVSKKNALLDKLFKPVLGTKESQERDFEQLALDKLVAMAYEKYMMFCAPTGGKGSNNKMAKQASLAFMKRTLDRCRQFEKTGKSCFHEPSFRDIFHSGSSHLSLARLTASKKLQRSPSQLQLAQVDQYDINCSHLPNNLSGKGKGDAGPNRVKKREMSLEEVVGGNSFSVPLSSSTKGKRSDRDRDGRGHGREVISRSVNAKGNGLAVSNTKGERKSKARPKQKMSQLSESITDLVENSANQSKSMMVSGLKLTEVAHASNSNEKMECGSDQLEDPLDFSSLQLPGIDDFGVSDDIGGQAQDLASWLNFDDDNLQDDDFTGLEIPMDDLSDLNMMV